MMDFSLGIEQWNQDRFTDVGLSYLTSGYGFLISRYDYETWKSIIHVENADIAEVSVHCYLYVQDAELSFLVVDSVSDQNRDYRLNETVFIEKFKTFSPLEGLGSLDIPAIDLADQHSEYMCRIIRWLIYAGLWFQNKINGYPYPNGGPVRAFIIPFQDLDTIFSMNSGDLSTDNVALFFGLKDFQDENGVDITDVELILCNSSFVDATGEKLLVETFADLSSPCPPFCGQAEGLNLLY